MSELLNTTDSGRSISNTASLGKEPKYDNRLHLLVQLSLLQALLKCLLLLLVLFQPSRVIAQYALEHCLCCEDEKRIRRTRLERDTDLALLTLHVMHGEYGDAAKGHRGRERCFCRA